MSNQPTNTVVQAISDMPMDQRTMLLSNMLIEKPEVFETSALKQLAKAVFDTNWEDLTEDQIDHLIEKHRLMSAQSGRIYTVPACDSEAAIKASATVRNFVKLFFWYANQLQDLVTTDEALLKERNFTQLAYSEARLCSRFLKDVATYQGEAMVAIKTINRLYFSQLPKGTNPDQLV